MEKNFSAWIGTVTIRVESNFLSEKATRLWEGPLSNVFTAWDQALWISTFAGSPSIFLSCEKQRERERDAFGYCPDKKRLVENFVELETTTGNNFPGVIPNSVSSMPLHVINAILARVLLNYSTAQLYTTFPPLISYLPPASPIPRSTIHLDIDEFEKSRIFFLFFFYKEYNRRQVQILGKSSQKNSNSSTIERNRPPLLLLNALTTISSSVPINRNFNRSQTLLLIKHGLEIGYKSSNSFSPRICDYQNRGRRSSSPRDSIKTTTLPPRFSRVSRRARDKVTRCFHVRRTLVVHLCSHFHSCSINLRAQPQTRRPP